MKELGAPSVQSIIACRVRVYYVYIYIYLSGVDARVSLVDSARSGAQKHLDEHAQNVAPLESAAALLLGRLRFSI